MRKIIAISIGIILMSYSTIASSSNSGENYYSGYGNSYIFVVQNVEFSIFPDGQFDFTYVNNRSGSNVNIMATSPYINISYNSGYNYDMYVQYDYYGAVIQIEDIPIYYDEFGRIAQAGDVEIFYTDRRIVQIGGLFIHYNYYGNYSHSTGYINPFNYYYVYQPWHRYYSRPLYASCIVYGLPYRRYYQPIRYTYYEHSTYYSNRGRSNINYTNGRRSFYRPGSYTHHKNGRMAVNKDYKPNRRNATRSQNGRRDNTVTQSSRRDNTVAQSSSRENSVSRRSSSNTTTVSNNSRSNTNRGIRSTSNYNRKVATNKKLKTRQNSTSNSVYKRPTSSIKKNKSISKTTSTNRNSNSKTTRNSTVSSSKRKISNKSNSSKSRGSSSRRGV